MGVTSKNGITFFSLLLALAFVMISILPAEATSTDSDFDDDNYEWNVLTEEDLLNDPTAAKILENIEISKQRIAQLQNPQVIKSEHQKFIDLQRQLVEVRLQEELDRINKKYADYTPRAAFAKYVAKKPAMYHDMYWELFEYLEHKVIFARQARDEIIENGGTSKDAQQMFIQLASMPKAERIWKVQQLNVKYGFLNKVSNIYDYDALPIEYKNALEEYRKLTDAEKKELYFNGQLSKKYVSNNLVKNDLNANSQTNAFVLGTIEGKISDTKENIISAEQGENFQISTDVLTDQGTLEMAFDDISLQLTGNDYVTKDVDSMDSVSEFTLSAWVNPSYDEGSSELTILSKENAFALTINNVKWPEKIVRFSIFDGIKWTIIESTSTVEEEWTHIAATLDDSSISLYINGKIEATKKIEGIPTLNSRGYLEVKSFESISSDSEIIIGAQLSSKRGIDKSMGFFSGLVDEVVIEDESLAEEQIDELCQQSEHFSI